jgi:hypothetical protein
MWNPLRLSRPDPRPRARVPRRAILAVGLLMWPAVGLGFAFQRPPEVGEIAPALGSLDWLRLEGPSATFETDLAALRGKVVVVADYGYYCDSCLRVGVPTLKALRQANDGEALRLIQLTAAIGDDDAEGIAEEARKLGLVGPVGLADVEGQSSPYLNMDANGNLTFAFVIGRHGGVVWKGDPSRKREEYLEAVSAALHAVPCEPLPAAGSFGPELAPALREYVLGNFLKAEGEARALEKKQAGKSGPVALRLRTESAALAGLVEATRKSLMEELERSGGERHAERFQRAALHVRRAFPKGPEADRVASLEMYVTIQNDGGPACRQWAQWYALEAARPATFPAERDGPNSKYARELAKYVKQPEVPGLEQARRWLAAFEALPARK